MSVLSLGTAAGILLIGVGITGFLRTHKDEPVEPETLVVEPARPCFRILRGGDRIYDWAEHWEESQWP